MKMTKQMKEDMIFLQKAVRILHEYWGKEGVGRFLKIKVGIDHEVESMLRKPMHEVREYISKSFIAWGWDTDKIKKWFAGQKSPFRNNVQLGEQDAANVLVAEFGLGKLMIALQNNGISYKDAEHLVVATFIAGRHQYSNLKVGNNGKKV